MKKVAVILISIVLTLVIPTSIAWEEYPSNPIYGASLGDGTAYYPYVLKDESNFSGHGNDSIWRMWYDDASGVPKHIISSDGINWKGKVACTNISNAYHPIVTYDEDGFNGNGYYFRMDWCTIPGGSTDINTMRFAWSTDGLAWENEAPIQQSATNTTHKLCGNVNDWFYQTCGASQVLYNAEGTNTGWNTIDDKTDDDPWNYTWVYLYSTATSGGPTTGIEHACLAYSANGTYFIRYGNEPIIIANETGWDDNYAYHLKVIVGAETFVGWYSGGTTYNEGIGLVYSCDGLNWKKAIGNPIMHKDDGVSWRSARTYTAYGFKDDDIFKMWFTGQDAGGNKSIGYTTFENMQPIIINQTIVNGTSYASVYNPVLTVTISDEDSPALFVYFKYANGSLIKKIPFISNGSTVIVNLSEVQTYPWLKHDTTYYWYIEVNDLFSNYTGDIWHFTTSKAWDCNEDRIVNYLDISVVISIYGDTGYLPGEIPADIVEDGDVNYLDISILISHYGESY